MDWEQQLIQHSVCRVNQRLMVFFFPPVMIPFTSPCAPLTWFSVFWLGGFCYFNPVNDCLFAYCYRRHNAHFQSLYLFWGSTWISLHDSQLKETSFIYLLPALYAATSVQPLSETGHYSFCLFETSSRRAHSVLIDYINNSSQIWLHFYHSSLNK